MLIRLDLACSYDLVLPLLLARAKNVDKSFMPVAQFNVVSNDGNVQHWA